ncbi:MAG: phospholipase D-like domain-containing protein, partial [Bradymonadaceae bacterium]
LDAPGDEVTVITNSKNSTDAWWVYYAGLNYYQELIRAGVKIYEYNGTETLHSKTMLIDGELALIGSFNLDPRSAIDNSEFMLLIRGGQTAKELHQTMEHDRANSTLATDDIPFTELVKASSMRLAEPLL